MVPCQRHLKDHLLSSHPDSTCPLPPWDILRAKDTAAPRRESVSPSDTENAWNRELCGH